MKCLRWIAARLKDLFYGPNNAYLDLGRVVGFIAALCLIIAALWNMLVLGKEIDLGPGGLGGGLAAVVGAIAGLIAAKDYVRGKVTPEG